MNDWECGVCGYIHKEGEAPEKCPVCEAPKVMFKEQVAEEVSEVSEVSEVAEVAEVAEEVEKEEKVVADEVKQWRCTISGYLHTGVTPPDKCPICEATSEMFEVVDEKEDQDTEVLAETEKRWRCSVCGYIHTGSEPPEACPVCAAPKKMFVEIDADGNSIGEIVSEPVEPIGGEAGLDGVKTEEKSFLNTIGKLILKFHLHPITAHFPNGILPAVVLFLCIAVFFKIAILERVAHFNLIFVLAMLPVVIVTGYVEWQKRYQGMKTAIFIVKIICALTVLGSVNVLVFWPLIDPQVIQDGSQYQLIYLGVAGLMLGAAGIAGHLGGKLVFASRG